MGVLRQNYGISSNITTGIYVQNSLESNIPSQSIINEVNGNKVNSNAQLQVELLKHSKGDTITLTIMNKDGLNNRQVSVTLR